VARAKNKNKMKPKFNFLFSVEKNDAENGVNVTTQRFYFANYKDNFIGYIDKVKKVCDNRELSNCDDGSWRNPYEVVEYTLEGADIPVIYRKWDIDRAAFGAEQFAPIEDFLIPTSAGEALMYGTTCMADLAERLLKIQALTNS